MNKTATYRALSQAMTGEQPAVNLENDCPRRNSIPYHYADMTRRLILLNVLIATLSTQYPAYPKTDTFSDRIVFNYAGKPVYCRSLTGLPYFKGLSYVQSAYKYYKEGQDITTGYSVTSSEQFMDKLVPSKSKPLENLYDWQISSTIALFIGSKIYHSLTTHYSTEKDIYFKSVDIPRYLARVAVAKQSKNEEFLALLLGNMPPEDFLRSRKFDKKLLPRLMESLPRMKERTASYFIRQKCFPSVIDDHPSPWLKYLADTALIRSYLSCLFFENRNLERKYLLKVINQDPEYRIAYIRNLEQNCMKSMQMFLCSLTDDNGCIAGRRFTLFQDNLQSMGSRVRISIFPIKRSKLIQRFHVQEKNLTHHRMLKVYPAGEISRKSDASREYIFIFGRNIDFSLEFGRSESSALAYFCHDIIKRELDAVVNRIKIEPPFVMPSYEKMVEGFFRKTYFPVDVNDCNEIVKRIDGLPNSLEKTNDILCVIERKKLLGMWDVQFVRNDRLKFLLNEVERLCESSLDEVPAVGFYSAYGMRLAILRCANERVEFIGCSRLRDLIRFSDNVSAFYDPKRKEIYVNIHRWVICNEAKNQEEIQRKHDSLLLHELIHAWQYEKLPVKYTNSNKSIIDSLLEGHVNSAPYEDLQAAYGSVEFALVGYYVNGLRFIEYLAKKKPPLSIRDVFKRGLPTQRQIIFPDEYLKGFQPKMLDMTPIVAVLTAQEKGVAAKTELTRIEFVDMRLMLYRSGFTKVGIETACRYYRGGQRIEQPGQVSAVFAFAPTRHDFVPVYIRRCTSETLINRDVRVKRGHRLDLPEAVAATTDAWITPAWDEHRGRPAQAKDGKPLWPSMHAVFAGRYLYIRSEWKTAPKSDKDALKVLLPFIDRCRKADAECAKFFKDESGDDEWD